MISGKRISFRIFLGLLIALPALAGEPTAVSLQAILSPPERPLSIRYHEEKNLQILNQTLTSSGLLRFIPPDTLVREVDGWRNMIYHIEGDQISISEGDLVLRRLDLKVSPDLTAIVTTLRALLAADIKTLEKHYSLTLSGTPSDWTLLLTPRNETLSQVVEKISISGENGQIRKIDNYESGGNHSHMVLLPDE